MALVKALPTAFGVEATYWTIYALDFSPVQGGGSAVLAGFLNEAARRAGQQPLATVTVPLNRSDLSDAAAVALSDIYGAVRRLSAGTEGGLLPDLSDALDG